MGGGVHQSRNYSYKMKKYLLLLPITAVIQVLQVSRLFASNEISASNANDASNASNINNASNASDTSNASKTSTSTYRRPGLYEEGAMRWKREVLGWRQAGTLLQPEACLAKTTFVRWKKLPATDFHPESAVRKKCSLYIRRQPRLLPALPCFSLAMAMTKWL